MEINQYAVTASEMKDLSFLDIDQYVSAGVYQSQKVPVSLVKAYMLSENIEQILLADMQTLALAGDLVSLKNYLIDDGSTLYLVMAAGGVGNQIYQYAIDVTTGLFGTFDLVTGVFTATSGVYIKDGGNNVFYSAAEQGTTSLTGACKNNTFQQNAENNILVLDNENNVFYQSASNNELGDSSGSNVFGISASLNILADGCSNNIFEQGAQNNELGSNCIGNTFEQYANGFKFNANLQNVTIEANTIGGNYLAVGYAFMYGQNYPATIFTDGVTNFYRYYDPVNDRIVLHNLFTPLAAPTYIGGGAGSGTVTSVGLSMPSAFSVASSPVTTSGTIAVTGAGLTSQYVRGDGSLANFPSSGGGGASVNYYLNGSVSQGTFGGVAMREINKVPIIGTGTDFTIATNGYIQSFITDANDPNQLSIPAGNWNFETFFSASSGGGSPSFYIELHKWDGTTLTLIATSSATPEGITGGTAIDLYTTALAVPQTTLALTDRLAIRIYVTNSGRTITLHTENSHLCQVITTFTTGLTALNGLTEQVQTLEVGSTGTDFSIVSLSSIHKFLLPTASASARGALSSADWSAFNAKVTSFASAADGAVTNLPTVQTSISVLIPANTFALDDIVRINYRVRSTGTNGIKEARILVNTIPSLAGAIVVSTSTFAATILAANIQRYLAIKNSTTNTEVISATTSLLVDYSNVASPASVTTLAINWTVDQYIIIGINAANTADTIRATMYSIEKL